GGRRRWPRPSPGPGQLRAACPGLRMSSWVHLGSLRPGTGVAPGPARIAAWCGAARAGCVTGPLAYTSCNSRMGNPDVGERLVLGERAVCEVGAVAITKGDRTSGAAPPSFRAERRFRTQLLV